MIDPLFYSIAGKKPSQTVDVVLQGWRDSSFVPDPIKVSIDYTLSASKEGNYPGVDYYKMAGYFDSGMRYTTLSEIVTYSKSVTDFFQRQELQRELISAINVAQSTNELQSLVSKAAESNKVQQGDFSRFKPKTFKEIAESPHTEGLKTGIGPLDEVTNGLQEHSMAFIAAYTAGGKSTCANSIAFKNAMLGKKSAIISLEMAPDIVWMYLRARYMVEVKGLQVTSTDFLHRKITKELGKKIESFEEDFQKDIVSNILITDSSVIPKDVAMSSSAIVQLYSSFDQELCGLHCVVHDHIGQYERLYPECGNTIIKQITDATVRFKTKAGHGVVSLCPCQVNREGYKRAQRRNGIFDEAAVADLNEIERSAVYLIFLFTPQELAMMQETKVSMVKHRLGPPMPEPVNVAFLPAICTVGSTVEMISYSDDFSDLGSDFGGMDFGSMGDVL